MFQNTKAVKDHKYFMNIALDEAERALSINEVPIGAIIVRDNEIELMKQYHNGLYQSVSLTEITRGQLYKISEGIFAGKTGKIVETQKNKIKLELEGLGMTVSLRLQAA